MSKKLIGYTTGVFDMFHIGHLNILKKAKEHCDYLIVGVSSDELVLRYKNKRPIIPFHDRKKIVSAIRYVDEVRGVDNRNKVEAFNKIGYDVLFVGDDWKGDRIFNELEHHLKLHGSKIIYFKYTKNVSSTKFSKLLSSLTQNKIG